MPLNLPDMINMVRGPLGLDKDDPEWPDLRITLYLNRAFWEIQHKFPFKEKEQTVRFNTVAGQPAYEIPQPFESLINVSIASLDTNQHTQLAKMDVWEYESLYDSDDDQQGFPVKYTHENCFIRLWPTPNKGSDVIGNIGYGGYPIILKKRITLTDISSSHANLSIPQEWNEIIGFGGQWRAYQDVGDLARATATRNLSSAMMNEMTTVDIKEKLANNQMAGVQPLRPKYEL